MVSWPLVAIVTIADVSLATLIRKTVAIWASATLALSAAQTTPTVTSKVVTVSSRNYTVYEYPDLESKTYCVVIPEGLRTVRGLLVNANYYGGDSRGDWTFCHYYREFMHLHDFALVAANGTCPHTNAFKGFRKSLQEISVASKHPELVNVPYAAVGFSAGGGFASTLMTYDPDRTIAAGIIEARYNFDVFTRPNPPPGPTAAHLAIPSVLVSGGKENTNALTGVLKMVDDVFVPHRPKGAEFAWVVLPDYGHEYAENRQDLLIMPLMDLAVRTRYPKNADPTKGPIKLLNIDPATGWVADNTTWQSGLTKIVQAREFKGDLGHSSWLQNEDIAFIYRAYATHNHPIAITSPGPCGPGTPAVDPGSNVPITVDASKFPNWTRLELYDGARKLGAVTRAPTQFTAKNLTPGYHVFSVLGTDVQGNQRTSDPRMVVVRTPATDVSRTDKVVPLATPVSFTAEPVGRIAPDSSLTVTFPDMPPTFHALFARQDQKVKMTIYLPRNYDPAKKQPLLVYLNGGDGGDGSTLGVARGITGQEDFVCVSLPLFRAPGFKVEKANSPGKDFILTEPDGRAMWPLFKTMLEKVEALVPNIDQSHRVVGGFSNGAHAIAALIDGSDGEICKLFSAFLIVEGGGKLRHFEYLKGKLYLMVSSQSGSKPRALQIMEEAKAAGARTTFLFEDVGQHDFPVSAYPAVRTWLRGPVLE